MFHNIPNKILDRMQELEQQDDKDRLDGTAHLQRLRQIPPETGRFLAMMAALAPEGVFLEVGTSAAYSSLWIALAMAERNEKLITFELLPEKVSLAQDTIKKTGTASHIHLIRGDARAHLAGYRDIAFAFLDAEKEIYDVCYDLILPNLLPGGILIADNIISHRDTLQVFTNRVKADPQVDSLVIPIGKGLLLCRKPSPLIV